MAVEYMANPSCTFCCKTLGTYSTFCFTVPLGSSRKLRNETTMGDKRVETLGNKINFQVSWTHFPPFFYFFDFLDHSAYTTLNWGAGGIRELTLDANKLEQVLNVAYYSFS